MAWNFGDGFDLYGSVTDMPNGYWDGTSSISNLGLAAGRFAGSRAMIMTTTGGSVITKTSGVNDTVHHFAVAFEQTAAIGGTNLGIYIQLLDGATAQCSIVFRGDGAILLYSGSAFTTILATYTGAFSATNTWYGFEFEVVINNTTGSFAVRKNGNTTNDFTATGLNTRVSANNYANKIQIAESAVFNAHLFDDFYWCSDASSVAWMGDIRCYTRMPASDVSLQFSRFPLTFTQTPLGNFNAQGTQATWSFYSPITPTGSGTVGTVTATLFTGFTGNLKCSAFNDSAGQPGTVRGSATTVTNPTGTVTFTFPTPFAVTAGTQYWIGWSADGTYANAFNSSASGTAGRISTTTGYSAFPAASPTVSNNNAIIFSMVITYSSNFNAVNEPQEDAATTYVYDSNPGDADLYGISSIGAASPATIAVVTRAYMQKSAAGARTAAAQLKSGGTTVVSPTLTLSNTGWLWTYRTDLVDPATGSAWAPTAVAALQIGPKVIA